MGLYINTDNNDYPVYEGDIRLLHVEMGEEFVLPSNYAVVEEGILPKAIGKCFDEQLPQPTDSGVYRRVFIERDLTEEEIARSAAMRKQYESAVSISPTPDEMTASTE